MEQYKFKRGDKVTVVSENFIKENFSYSEVSDSFVDSTDTHFRREMFAFCGKTFEIEIDDNLNYSLIGADWFWSSQMLRPATSLNNIYD